MARGVTVEVITHLPLNTKESRGQQKKKFICVTTEEEKTFQQYRQRNFYLIMSEYYLSGYEYF